MDLVESKGNLPCVAQLVFQLLHSQSHCWNHIIVPHLDHFNHLCESKLVVLIPHFWEVSDVAERVQVPIPHLKKEKWLKDQTSVLLPHQMVNSARIIIWLKKYLSIKHTFFADFRYYSIKSICGPLRGPE